MVEPQEAELRAVPAKHAKPFVDLIQRYLETIPSTLWSRAWDIKSPQDRKDAAMWFCDQFFAMTQFSEKEKGEQA